MKKLLPINKIIIYLTLSDVFVWGLILVVNSFIGLYLAGRLEGDTLKIVGIGLAISNLAKGGFQIPIGILIDKIQGQKDELIALMTGSIIIGLVFVLYSQVNSEYFYYLLQFFLGLGFAMNLVSWRKIFALHLDKGKEGLEYGLYDAIFSIMTAIFGVLAGFIANINDDYFDAVVVGIGILVILSSVWVIMIARDEYGENRKEKAIEDEIT